MPALSSIMGGSQPVGSIVQAPYNLTDPAHLPCDGRRVLRATYPRLSACLPSIGTFTATSRAKSATPTSSAIAADGTNWVVTGAVGTSNLYTTPDGITYTARATPGATDTRTLLHTGTNFVAAGPNGNAMYSPTGTTWTASASSSAQATASMLQTSMTYAPGLGGANGRIYLCGGTAAGGWTSDDHGVTWTVRVSGAFILYHVCWTGQNFIATGSAANTIYTSTDGITWAAQTMPFATSAATPTLGSIISDGNRKVLLVNATSNYIATSTDHGATWSLRTFFDQNGTQIALTAATNAVANYTNGRFFIFASGVQFTLISTDLAGWSISGEFAVGNTGCISHKAGVYLQNVTFNTTAASTIVEDTSYMRLPYTVPSAGQGNKTDYIKVS